MIGWFPEAQADPYVWLAVFGSHTAIGVALWLACLWMGTKRAIFGAIAVYIGWEVAGAIIWEPLFWDSLLDICAVSAGVLIAASIWSRNRLSASALVVSAGVVALFGVMARK